MTVPNLSLQRCFNHISREAAARCPECSRFFCRECVAEHEDRVLCASCLKKLSESGPSKRHAFATVMRSAQVVVGVLVAWFFFFMIGESLLRLPASFHDSSVWEDPWIDPQ